MAEFFPSLLPIVAYLLGSLSPARSFARRHGVDITAAGSKNPGATNVARTVSPGAGVVVMLLDVLKGYLPTGTAVWLFGSSSPWVLATGVAAVTGHLFPIFHGFRGGKGVATGAGVLAAATPAAAAVALCAFGLTRRVVGITSVASLMGAAAALGSALFLYSDLGRRLLPGTLLPVIALTHWDNWRRLAGDA